MKRFTAEVMVIPEDGKAVPKLIPLMRVVGKNAWTLAVCENKIGLIAGDLGQHTVTFSRNDLVISHYAATYNGKTLLVYVNYEVVLTLDIAIPEFDQSQIIVVGNYSMQLGASIGSGLMSWFLKKCKSSNNLARVSKPDLFNDPVSHHHA